MTRAVVQFNNAQIQININQGESGSEDKPAADILKEPAPPL